MFICTEEYTQIDDAGIVQNTTIFSWISYLQLAFGDRVLLIYNWVGTEEKWPFKQLVVTQYSNKKRVYVCGKQEPFGTTRALPKTLF